MPARLVPLIEGSTPVVSLQRPVVLIGRHLEADVRLDLPQISRRHCCIAQAYDRMLIRDLGSRNGVWVNGERVSESRLLHGDEVAIGPLIYRYEDLAVVRSDAIPPNPPPPEPAARPNAPVAPTYSDIDASSNDQEAELIPLDDLYPSFE